MNFDVRDQGKDLTLRFLNICIGDMQKSNKLTGDDPRNWNNVTGIVITPEQRDLFFTCHWGVIDNFQGKPLIVKEKE